MTQDRDALYCAWLMLRRRPAWLSVMTASLGLDAEDEAYLCDCEDALGALGREPQRAWAAALRELVAAARDGVPPAWIRQRRAEFLEQEATRLEAELDRVYQDYADAAQAGKPGEVRFLILEAADAAGMEKRLGRVEAERRGLACLGGSRKRLDEAVIERARQVPLERLVEDVRRRYILCPLHDDHRPSMWVKGGFGYCFSCGERLDSIGYLMRVRGLSFRAAVEALQ